MWLALVLPIVWTAASDATRPPGEPLDLIPDPVEFGDMEVGGAGEMSIHVRNDSDTVISVLAVRLEPDATPFAVVDDTCTGSALVIDGSCDVVVAFTPASASTFSATIVVDTDLGPTSGVVAGNAVHADEIEPPVDTGAVDTIAPVRPTLEPAATEPAAGTEPAGTEPAGTEPTVPTAAERLEVCERRAQNAQVAFAPELAMKVDETSQVRVTASVVDPSQGPTTSPGPGVTVESARLRCEVEATMRGADFRIDPQGPQPRSFLDQDVIEWSWDVVPTKAGTRVLTVEIRSIAVVDGRRIVGAAILHESRITVEAQDEGVGGTFTRWSSNVVDHPLVRGFGSLLVVSGALAAGWKWLLKRPWPWSRRQQQPPA